MTVENFTPGLPFGETLRRTLLRGVLVEDRIARRVEHRALDEARRQDESGKGQTDLRGPGARGGRVAASRGRTAEQGTASMVFSSVWNGYEYTTLTKSLRYSTDPWPICARTPG